MLVVTELLYELDGTKAWAGDAALRQDMAAVLSAKGALLVRNTGIETTAELTELLRCMMGSGSLLPYEEDKTSPRTRLDEFIYTSTDYRREAAIFFHNECCTRASWPMKIAFFCKHAPKRGGRTPICDIEHVTRHIPEAIEAEFRERGIRYIRNLGGPLGHSVEYSFGTSDPVRLNQLFAAQGVSASWLSKDRIQLTFERPAFVKHPSTGAELWFNNALFWHPASLDGLLRLAVKNRSESDLAFYTRFGDGGEIPHDTLARLIRAYKESALSFEWQDGDLLVLDNMRFAHAREAYDDKCREIWFAMGEEHRGVAAPAEGRA